MMTWSELNFALLIFLVALLTTVSAFIYTQVLRVLDVLRDIQQTFARYLDWEIDRSERAGHRAEASRLRATAKGDGSDH